jgi:calcineurin-like phosphoesterase family protein
MPAHRRPETASSALAVSIFAFSILVLGVPTTFAGVSSASASLAAGDPVIAAAGDIACDPGDANFNGGNGTSASCRQRSTSDLLVNRGLAAVLPLGDVQYYCGGYNAFLQSYDSSWGRLKDITRPSVGNHEYLTTGGTDCTADNAGAAGYFRYFGSAAGQQGQGWYSYDIGAWHIIALNSNCSDVGGCAPGSPQYQWLSADLAAHQNACTLAYWHIPLFSSGGRTAENSRQFWNLLYANDADVILTGHDHIYERFAPQTPAAIVDPARGIRQFVVGTGGSNHTTIPSIAANSEVRNAGTFGVLELTLHPTSYDWNFRPESGMTFMDGGTGLCHSPTAPVFADDFESGSLGSWTTVSGLTVGQQEVHGGAWGARATSTAGTVAVAYKQLPAAHSDLSSRLWFKVIGQGQNVVDLLKLRTASGTALLTVFASPTGVLGYQNNVTAASTYSSAPVSRGVWHSLEVRVVINGTSSRSETWLDGQPVPALTKMESLGTTPIGRFQLGENISGRTYDVAFDDVVLTPPAP